MKDYLGSGQLVGAAVVVIAVFIVLAYFNGWG